jgi:repressor LexA
MAKGLTKRQEDILDFILQYVEGEGYPPSIREIGQNFEIGSLRGVTVHLDALERKGYISRSNTPRSIKLTHPKFTPGNSRVTMLPLVGSIAAGSLAVRAEQDIEGTIPVPMEMVKNTEGAFLLRIKGDSMIGDGIMPRDLVIVRPQKTFHGNDVMAVRVGEEAVIKRIHKTSKGVQLLSSNPDYAPIDVDPRETEVIGKVVGLMRDYDGVSF